VSLPTLLIFSSIQAINKSLRHIKEDNLKEMAEEGLLCPVEELTALLNK